MSEELYLPLTEQNNLIPAAFRNDLLTNSYKFFWLLGLLDVVRDWDDMAIPLREVAVRMLVRAWHPSAVFKLNFGKADQLNEVIHVVQKESGLGDKASEPELLRFFKSISATSPVQTEIDKLIKYVPYRLLTPWFQAELKGRKDHLKNQIILELSQTRSMDRSQAPLYFFKDKDSIQLTWQWRGYLIDHNAILVDFVNWRLAEFLQVRNPNVQNIAAKLVSQSGNRRHAKYRVSFEAFLRGNPGERCIYSNGSLQLFDVDHFVPFSFTAHDLPWNLIPTNPDANKQKRDQLPDISYIPRVADFQFRFLRFLVQNDHVRLRGEIVESFEFLLKQDIHTIVRWEGEAFERELSECFTPLLIQARHQGFFGPWVYS